MKLRSDDDIHRVRLVYLGPPGYTLPVQLPYAQWGLFATLAFGLVTVSVSVTGTWMSGGVALAAAIFLTSYIWGHVDPDRPVRKVIKVALTDWQRVRPPSGTLPRLSAGHIKFRDEITGDVR